MKRWGDFGNYENKYNLLKVGCSLMGRIEQLKSIFENVDEDKRTVIEPLLDEVVFLENKLVELRRLPLLRVHPNNPEKQETTPAGKMYKEYMQSYLNAVKVLQSTLSRYTQEEQDAFDKWLEENG